MRSFAVLSLMTLVAVAGGCGTDIVEVEWGVSPMITDGARAHDDSGETSYGASPRLRRMERMHRFVYCDEGRRFNGLAGTASILADLRPRRVVAIGDAGSRSRERWKYLCEFDLRRNSGQIEPWMVEVHRQRDIDRAYYRKWLASESRNPRLAVRALETYWCGRDRAVPRIAFLAALKRKATKLYPSEYIAYEGEIEKARTVLHELCRSRRSTRDDILWTYRKAREVRRLWEAALHAIPHLG